MKRKENEELKDGLMERRRGHPLTENSREKSSRGEVKRSKTVFVLTCF